MLEPHRHQGTDSSRVRFQDLQEVNDFGQLTQGDTLYADANNKLQRLSAGTTGQFLQTQGAGANPAWASPTDAKLQFANRVNGSASNNTSAGNDVIVRSLTNIAFATINDMLVIHVEGFDPATPTWKLKVGSSTIFSQTCSTNAHLHFVIKIMLSNSLATQVGWYGAVSENANTTWEISNKISSSVLMSGTFTLDWVVNSSAGGNTATSQYMNAYIING